MKLWGRTESLTVERQSVSIRWMRFSLRDVANHPVEYRSSGKLHFRETQISGEGASVAPQRLDLCGTPRGVSGVCRQTVQKTVFGGLARECGDQQGDVLAHDVY